MEWVDEHTHEDRALLGGKANELSVALMQATHGGHKLKLSMETGSEDLQLGLRGENSKAQRSTSSLTWAIPDAVNPRSEAAPWPRSITR